eukprot:1160353-Pelagomonas_calceolata.AAC.8
MTWRCGLATDSVWCGRGSGLQCWSSNELQKHGLDVSLAVERREEYMEEDESRRAREIKEELEDRLEEDEHSGAQATQNPNQLNGTIQIAPTYYVDPDGEARACAVVCERGSGEEVGCDHSDMWVEVVFTVVLGVTPFVDLRLWKGGCRPCFTKKAWQSKPADRCHHAALPPSALAT